jgi:hypothetical protein
MGNLQLKTFCSQLRNYKVQRIGLLGTYLCSTFKVIGILEANEFFNETTSVSFNLFSRIKITSRAFYQNMGM